MRFWLWFTASMKFLFPFALLTLLGRDILSLLSPAGTMPVFTLIRPAAVHFVVFRRTAGAPAPARVPAADPVLVLWAAGFVGHRLPRPVRWLDLRAILQDANPVAIEAPVAVKSAPSLLEPGLVGLRRPSILLPVGLAQLLTRAEMNAILAHELCHLRRRDNLLTALHMLVEGLFWFYPLVWLIGPRLIDERERACDESVLAAGVRPLSLCRWHPQGLPLLCPVAAGLRLRRVRAPTSSCASAPSSRTSQTRACFRPPKRCCSRWPLAPP